MTAFAQSASPAAAPAAAPVRRQRGFALAMTLWILAAIMVAATIFSERVRQAVNLAERQQKAVDAQLALAATNAEILFRIGTTPISIYGLGDQPDGKSIWLDNRLYHGTGNTLLQLQDDRGLVNLNVVSDERLLRLLAIVDVPADKRGMLIDTLRDYMDEDSLKRINGAEEPEYRERGLPPPRNENLLTPYEARSIIGWRDLPQLWENNRLPDLITISTAVAVNPNTASKEVLATLPGVTNEIADAIIARRQVTPIATPDIIAQMVGVAPGDYLLNIITLPADSMRVTLRSPDLPWAIQYNVSLSPNNDKAPWRIDYYYKIRQDASQPQAAPAASGTTTGSASGPTTSPFTSSSSLFVTPGLNSTKTNEIPELPPRYTIAVSAP